MLKKMNPEVKKLWVDALRSGEYKQAQGCLRSYNDTYCCLGVLCDIYSKNHSGTSWDEFEGIYNFNDGQSGIDSGVLTAEVKKWAEVDFSNPIIGPNEDMDYAASLNDKGIAFGKIADMIEENL